LKFYVIIPVKSLSEGKRRLARILGEKERKILTFCMLQDVLSVVLRSEKVNEAVVVSPDREILRLAKKLGAVALAEKANLGVNMAVSAGIKYCVRRSSPVLVLPADIPLVSGWDLEAMASLGSSKPSIVICPSLRLNGTNALLLNPPDIIETSYDADSFRGHLSAGRLKGLRVKVYLSGRVMLDLDVPEDLELFLKLEASMNTETYRFALEALKSGVKS
jgi:2-phospho-L-lactate guanylyltransferase